MIQKNWKILQKLQNKIFKIWLLFSILSCMAAIDAYEKKDTYLAGQVPEELKGLEMQEQLGEHINLNTAFTDDKGRIVKIGDYFKNNQPVLLSIVYYNCPSLCGLHLNGVSEALQFLPEDFKQQFNFVTVSMDETETPQLASKKKSNYIKKYALPDTRTHFLTGAKENILSLSQEVGFRFRWDEEQKIFAHIPVAYVLSPAGKISRYLYGVQFDRKTMKLSLVEASQGRIGSVIDRALLFCFQFNPNKGRYSWYAYNIMRAGGILTVVLLFSFLIPVWIRESKKMKKDIS